MLVHDVMCLEPVTADVDTPIRDVARSMEEFGCGEIPITEGKRLVGVLTDRDIVCRVVAFEIDPLTATARDVMTRRPARIRPDDSIEHAIELMEEMQIRRLPVVDGEGAVVGILSMTDVCLCTPCSTAGTLLHEISRRRPPVPRRVRGPEVFPPY
jgi:CBS domain-containing protein